MDQLWLDFDVMSKRSVRPAVELMVADLQQHDRLTTEHAPLVSLFLKLADALDAAGGRGASVAMLSAEFQKTWDRLVSLTRLEADDDQGDEFDVVLLQAVEPPAEPAALPDAS